MENSAGPARRTQQHLGRSPASNECGATASAIELKQPQRTSKFSVKQSLLKYLRKRLRKSASNSVRKLNRALKAEGNRPIAIAHRSQGPIMDVSTTRLSETQSIVDHRPVAPSSLSIVNLDSARTTVKLTTAEHTDKSSLSSSTGMVLPDVKFTRKDPSRGNYISSHGDHSDFKNISRPIDSTIHEPTDSVQRSTAGDHFVLTTTHYSETDEGARYGPSPAYTWRFCARRWHVP